MIRIATMGVILTTLSLAAPAHADDVAGGSATFRQTCMMCHTVTPNAKPGAAPNLFGLPGRRAASTVFPYSTALKNSNIVWSTDTLDKFLSGPNKMVPGTRMIVTVSDDVKRRNLVAYLMSLKQ